MLVNEPRFASQGNLPLEHAASRALYRHWEAIRAERAAPSRHDLNLQPIAGLVSNMAILEQRNGAGEFLWRLAGTGICALLGREVTGGRFATGFDAFEADVVHRFLLGVTEHLQPCVLKLNLANDTGGKTPVEIISLPILAQSGGYFQVLAGMFDFSESTALPNRKIVAVHLLGARSIWTEHLPGDSLVKKAEAGGIRRPQLQVLPGGKP